MIGMQLASLIDPVGPISLAKALWDLIRQGLSIALTGLVSAASLAISVIGFALGINIMAVNGPNGVCVYCSWPYTGGIVLWAALR
jgi:uncharacterized membrane protein YccF (DUF307 family)